MNAKRTPSTPQSVVKTFCWRRRTWGRLQEWSFPLPGSHWWNLFLVSFLKWMVEHKMDDSVTIAYITISVFVLYIYIYEYVLHDRTIKMLMIWIFHQFKENSKIGVWVDPLCLYTSKQQVLWPKWWFQHKTLAKCHMFGCDFFGVHLALAHGQFEHTKSQNQAASNHWWGSIVLRDHT